MQTHKGGDTKKLERAVNGVRAVAKRFRAEEDELGKKKDKDPIGTTLQSLRQLSNDMKTVLGEIEGAVADLEGSGDNEQGDEDDPVGDQASGISEPPDRTTEVQRVIGEGTPSNTRESAHNAPNGEVSGEFGIWRPEIFCV